MRTKHSLENFTLDFHFICAVKQSRCSLLRRQAVPSGISLPPWAPSQSRTFPESARRDRSHWRGRGGTSAPLRGSQRRDLQGGSLDKHRKVATATVRAQLRGGEGRDGVIRSFSPRSSWTFCRAISNSGTVFLTWAVSMDRKNLERDSVSDESLLCCRATLF